MSNIDTIKSILDHADEVGNGTDEILEQLILARVIAPDNATVIYHLQGQRNGYWSTAATFRCLADALDDSDAERAMCPDVPLRIVSCAASETVEWESANNNDEE